MNPNFVKASFFGLACCLVLPASATAQDLRGYLAAGPMAASGTPNTSASFGVIPTPVTALPPTGTMFNAAGGFEVHFGRYLGTGIDLSGIFPGTGQVGANTVGTMSPNVYFHITPHSDWPGARFDAYATAGYTLLFQNYGANGFNAGAGVNYWFGAHFGTILEFRAIRALGSNPPTPETNYYQIRFGVTFR